MNSFSVISPLPAFPPGCPHLSAAASTQFASALRVATGTRPPWCFPVDSPHGRSGRVLPASHAAVPHGSFAPEGVCCPFPPRSYDPICQSRRPSLGGSARGDPRDPLFWLAVSPRLPSCTHAGRPPACRRPVSSASASAIAQSRVAWHLHSPQSALSTLPGSWWAGVTALSVRPWLRPSKWLALLV
jgi:hypothetical protein